MNTITVNGRSTQGQYSDVIAQAETLVNAALTDGGVTLNRSGGDVPTTGYVVGGKVPSLVLDTESPVYKLFGCEGVVADWLGAAPRFGSGNNYVGSWIDTDTGKLYIDLVDVIDFRHAGYGQGEETTREVAVRLGRERGELAIWDIDNAAEIRL